MKKTSVIFLLILLNSVVLYSESVKHLKSIKLGFNKNENKIISFIFGKKKRAKITPTSIFRINNKQFCLIDNPKNLVFVMDQNWKIIKTINKAGKNYFRSPVSGCSTMEGHFYISDSYHRKVFEYNKNFKFRRVILNDPNIRVTGISCFDNKLFCVDTLNHRIIVLDKEGKKMFEFGSRGVKPGEFNYPTHILVNTKNIYINDALNFRIQIFDHKGNFINTFGKNGRRGGDLSKPKGIGIDSKNRIYVLDVNFDNVQVFSEKGDFLSFFGGPGDEDGKFWMPSGILIDDNDHIYIADTYNFRIQVFSIVTEIQ